MFLFFLQFKPWRSYKGCSYKKKECRPTFPLMVNTNWDIVPNFLDFLFWCLPLCGLTELVWTTQKETVSSFVENYYSGGWSGRDRWLDKLEIMLNLTLAKCWWEKLSPKAICYNECWPPKIFGPTCLLEDLAKSF